MTSGDHHLTDPMLRTSQIVWTVLALVGLLLVGISLSAAAATLTIEIVGATNNKGHIAVAVFATSDGFPKDDARALHRARAAIDGASLSSTVTLTDLPAGNYAVSVFHDYNDSGKLETNFFGIPSKGYGFSNNPRPSMRAARFDEAQFVLPEGGSKVRVELMY